MKVNIRKCKFWEEKLAIKKTPSHLHKNTKWNLVVRCERAVVKLSNVWFYLTASNKYCTGCFESVFVPSLI